jgi:hypothetical protein
MNIKEKINKLSFVFFGFFIVFTVMLSEYVYILNNDHLYLRKYYLNKAKYFAVNNNVDKSFFYLFKATDLRINNQAKEYKSIFIKKDYSNLKENLLTSKSDKKVYLEYLKAIDIDKIFNSKDVDFLRIFYNLAIIASKNNYSDDILPSLRIAMFLEPQLSHIHIENANYYLLVNQRDKALEQLDICEALKSPSYHCNLYRKELLTNSEVKNVGFLKASIDEQYKQ